MSLLFKYIIRYFLTVLPGNRTEIDGISPYTVIFSFLSLLPKEVDLPSQL